MRNDLVVIGLGYVGLPLALEATRAGLTVTGLDRDPATVTSLNDGVSHVDDISNNDVSEMLKAHFTATHDESVIADAAVVVVCVPTPLSPHGGPDLTMVESACISISRHLRPGTLVVLESTTYPGTTDEVVRPILESSGLAAGTDFHLAFSPERVDPGNRLFGIRNTPKVVGGHTPDCTSAAASFYGKFVDEIVQSAGTREAEMAKLIENTYRHVNIALVNEMAVFCHELGIDLWNAIDCAATKPFGFQAFRPGPGVGGHCIPIDPNYLAHKVRTLGYPFRMVELAQEINTRMPRYVVERAQQLLDRSGKTLGGATVLLMGVTYKADIADQRETTARHVVQRLRALGAEVIFHDPYVPVWEVDGIPVKAAAGDLIKALASADLVILLQQHRSYDLDQIEQHAPLLLDTRGSAHAMAHVERL
ncbi:MULTISPECIES: nucleotide sugar dehydrogenase [Streptomyces]|uniref:Nucleotide sugar dehydrogenase n=1 Tax=Streptomyces evansiae TaxID=3075535 RepID=A0ABD5ED36_9ACTN|nr:MULTISPECIES: nucleotide sugar dehydrogenase [unclassified Streptomyces]ASY33111.1 UDP-N-acetyl-D-glucosamine dehydrogenase [Streptomyces sp. CLI2509]MDT0418487.1 nucleotide sugar dehydrogenase [Streptomyces sp. DSM 41982]MYX23241.1 nucleotide sugar dehydrogenase [Streptomyces sp. SID8380]SCE03220.1 nucleotide sugar dehydrogenase [Streptomyces sp. SolWspMP-sol7th]